MPRSSDALSLRSCQYQRSNIMGRPGSPQEFAFGTRLHISFVLQQESWMSFRCQVVHRREDVAIDSSL